MNMKNYTVDARIIWRIMEKIFLLTIIFDLKSQTGITHGIIDKKLGSSLRSQMK